MPDANSAPGHNPPVAVPRAMPASDWERPIKAEASGQAPDPLQTVGKAKYGLPGARSEASKQSVRIQRWFLPATRKPAS